MTEFHTDSEALSTEKTGSPKPVTISGKKIFLLAISFSAEMRAPAEWKVETLGEH